MRIHKVVNVTEGQDRCFSDILLLFCYLQKRNFCIFSYINWHHITDIWNVQDFLSQMELYF